MSGKGVTRVAGAAVFRRVCRSDICAERHDHRGDETETARGIIEDCDDNSGGNLVLKES